MLAAHLDADPVRSARASFQLRSQSHSNYASTRALHAKYLANRRGTAFGVPRDAYKTAVASMRAMERRRASSAAIVPLAAPTPFWTALGPVPITNETPIFGGDPIGGPVASASG